MENSAYYLATLDNFVREAQYPTLILDQLEQSHQSAFPEHSLSNEQLQAWESSVPFLRQLLDSDQFSGNELVILEAILKSRCKIDVMLCGRDISDHPQIALIELKTWHTTRRRGRKYEIHADPTAASDLAVVLHAVNEDTQELETTIQKQQNPRLQIGRYSSELRCEVKKLNLAPEPIITSCVALYNCIRLSEKTRDVLERNLNAAKIQNIPIITEQTWNGSYSTQWLQDKLIQKIGRGDGWQVYDDFSAALFDLD